MKKNETATFKEYKGFSLFMVALLVLFVLGSLFNNPYATYPFIIVEWAGLLIAILTINSESKTVLADDLKKFAKYYDIATYMVLIIFSAWWTLFAFISSWLLNRYKERKAA